MRKLLLIILTSMVSVELLEAQFDKEKLKEKLKSKVQKPKAIETLERCDLTFFKEKDLKNDLIDTSASITMKAQKEKVMSEEMCCAYGYRDNEVVLKQCSNLLHSIRWTKDKKTGTLYKQQETFIKGGQICYKNFDPEGNVVKESCEKNEDQ